MTELKSRDVTGFMRKPDLSKAVFLAYGPDQGLVSEVADKLAISSGVDLDDPFSLIKMPGDAAASESALVNEAYTVAMFAGKRLVRINHVSNDKALVSQVSAILDDPPQDAWIVMEGGELKKGSALRSLVEKSPNGVTIPCYSDGIQSVHALIDEVFPVSENRIDRDLRQYLAAHIGGDRALIRRELEKIDLLVADGAPAEIDDITALVGDTTSSDANTMIDAVICGEIEAFEALFSKLQTSGVNCNNVFFAAIRQFQKLDQMRMQMDQDRKSASAIVAAARPPVFFARRKTVERALGVWTAPAIRHAMQRLQDATLTARTNRELDYETAHLCLLGLTIAARRRR